MTKVSDLLAAGRTYSFEFFPPKNDAEQARLVQTLLELQPLRPSFVSVTYRGGPSSRQRTTDLVVSMLRLTTLNPMAHLTCTGPQPPRAGRHPGEFQEIRGREPDGTGRRPSDRPLRGGR